ncbi:MAG: hypothetical protein V3R32_05500 [Nitrosomonadaceae bacterium]
MYLSSIQQGIQAGHVIARMATKYQRTGDGFTPQGHTFYNWAEHHETMILLSAGYGENLHELEAFFEGTLDVPGVTRLSEEYDSYSPYPFAIFHESDEALDGAATSFGVILPPKIYEGCKAMRKALRDKRASEYFLFTKHRILVLDDAPEEIQYTKWEVELMERMGKFKLAQ